MTFDRILEPFAALVRRLTARLQYVGWYTATVLAQNADGTLELRPDDATLPSLSSVPVLSGVAGVTFTVSAGARVLVSFANADPSMPFAALWEAGTATITFNGGTHRVARKDDPIAAGTLSLAVAPNTPTPGLNTGTLTWTPSGGAPSVVGAFVIPGAVTAGSASLTGTITDGVSTVKA